MMSKEMSRFLSMMGTAAAVLGCRESFVWIIPEVHESNIILQRSLL